ncbi:hypothetical protein CKAN_02244600 [Cinnamomum micranthum f. kanehirae]|uniref:Uncharacterized protein n=1 Tax=Cinnamomum micranthum f. kanehirae TaxID=337451 RepID=A0A443PR01_9MAGN|nr:hypothetical protein CKAN_02244600 [Cinnamomum micranthum f. kanehirae]
MDESSDFSDWSENTFDEEEEAERLTAIYNVEVLRRVGLPATRKELAERGLPWTFSIELSLIENFENTPWDEEGTIYVPPPYAHLDGLGQNIIGDGRLRSKYGVCNGDDTWVLTAETGNGYSRCVADIGLEVNEANWEYKHITLVENLGYECIIVLVGEDKAHVERPFEDRQYLCGTWVCVRRVLSIRRKV